MSYTPEYTKPYPDGWQDGYGLTEVNAAFLNMLDNTIIKIEEFLKNNGSGDYALLTEAGYSLGLSIDEFYVMSISLLNKAGNVLSTKQIDLPIESMVVNASYADGKVTLTLQNGNTLDVDISDMVRGLVPTTRTIAGIDLADDITAEELVAAERAVSGEVYVDFEDSTEADEIIKEFMPYPTDASGKKLVGEEGQVYTSNGDGTFSWKENSNSGSTVPVTRTIAGIDLMDDITVEELQNALNVSGDSVVSGELKPWLYSTSEEIVIGVYNGKPLYRMTLPPIEVTTDKTLYLLDMDYDVIMIDNSVSYLIDSDGGIIGTFILGLNDNQELVEGYTANICIFDHNIYFRKGAEVSYTAYITLNYTKTTDAEGSGNELMPYGVYSGGSNSTSSTNYSTEEQCVGTWIDGKPLYQKSYTLLNHITDSSVVILDDTIKNTTHQLVDLKGSWAVGTWNYASSAQTSIFKDSYNGSVSASPPDIYISTDGLCFKSNCAVGWGLSVNLTIQYTKPSTV